MKVVLDFNVTARDYELAKKEAKRLDTLLSGEIIETDVTDSKGQFISNKIIYVESISAEPGALIDNFFIIVDSIGDYFTLQSEAIELV